MKGRTDVVPPTRVGGRSYLAEGLGLLFAVAHLVIPLHSWGEAEEVVVPEEAQAAATPEQRNPERSIHLLRHGMSYHEVVKTLGAPNERKEMESKRSATWEYGKAKVFFREGRVVAWTSDDARSETSLDTERAVGRPIEQQSPREASDEETIRSLLGEIMDSSQGAAVAPQVAPNMPAEGDGAMDTSKVSPDERISLPENIRELSPH